ncbi:MAG: co-chaperone GroES [Puniceicoccaceae bacterium]
MTITEKKQTITPIGDRVLLQRIETSEETRGGIYIPDSAKEKPQEALVVALGDGKRKENGEVIAFEVQAGDRVLISKYGGTEVNLSGEKYLLVREDDILGILSPSNA